MLSPQERGLLSPGYPGGLEPDEYDDQAKCFTEHDLTGIAGYVRLVRAPFPFLRHCELLPWVALPPIQQCAEVSRLVVREDLRGIDHGLPVSLKLYRRMYRHSCREGIRFWYAAMEPKLVRTLDRTGFTFDPIGPLAEWHGPIRPYIADLFALAQSLAAKNPKLLQFFDAPT